MKNSDQTVRMIEVRNAWFFNVFGPIQSSYSPWLNDEHANFSETGFLGLWAHRRSVKCCLGPVQMTIQVLTWDLVVCGPWEVRTKSPFWDVHDHMYMGVLRILCVFCTRITRTCTCTLHVPISAHVVMVWASANVIWAWEYPHKNQP